MCNKIFKICIMYHNNLMNYNKLDRNIVVKIKSFKYKICGKSLEKLLIFIDNEHKRKVNRFHAKGLCHYFIIIPITTCFIFLIFIYKK